MSDLNFLSAVSLAERIRQKKLSSVEVVRAHLAQIERLNPRLNAFVHVNSERALQQARAAEQAVQDGKPLGALHGIPISIKSSIEVEGMAFEAGTKLRMGCVGRTDAPLVQRLRSAGAVVLGVTNSPELLMAWETDNLIYGRTNNPWNVERTAGGSSGGESAAIAAGCSAGGVGSDGGGSIRVPAHFCGICGLKPTPGRIPATGHYPPSAGPFAAIGVVGPMARTIADVKIMFEVVQGPDDGDPSAAPVPVRWRSGSELRKIRIGCFEDDGRTPVTPETRMAVRKAARGLRDSGFEVEEFRPPALEEAREQWWNIFGRVGREILEPMTSGHGTEISPLLKEFLGWTEAYPRHTGASLLDTWVQRDLVRIKTFEQMRDFPVLLCPVAAVPAFRHGERCWNIDGQTVSYLDAWSYTEWFNLLGMPAAVVPIGESAEGLPIGMQICGKPWQEGIVLQIAEKLEAACGNLRRPPL